MNLLFVHSGESIYSNKRIIEEMNLEAIKFDEAEPKNLRALSLEPYELVYHRSLGLDYNDHYLKLFNNNLPFINSLDSIKKFRDKKTTYETLRTHGHIPLIPTLSFHGKPSLEELESELKSKNIQTDEFIVKPFRSFGGRGLIYIKSLYSLFTLLESQYYRKDQAYIIQPYIPFTREIRLFVIGGEAKYTIEKTPSKRDLRLNADHADHRLIEKCPARLNEYCSQIIEKHNLNLFAVDFCQTSAGDFYLVDLNLNPGFECLEKISGKNIAREIVHSFKEYQ